MNPIFQVMIGGAIGAGCRYGVAFLFAQKASKAASAPSFPWATLSVNCLGSFLMGVFAVLLAQNGGAKHAPLIMTGILGGFTTYSAFSLETITHIERGNIILAITYIAATLVLALGGLALGMYITRGILS